MEVFLFLFYFLKSLNFPKITEQVDPRLESIIFHLAHLWCFFFVFFFESNGKML